MEGVDMSSLAEFNFASNFWPGAASEKILSRSELLVKRYEVLLRLSRRLALVGSQDLVSCLTAELSHAVDFDVLDIVINAEASPTCAGDLSGWDPQRWNCSDMDAQGETEESIGSANWSRLSADRETRSQCVIPLICRSSELGCLVLERHVERAFDAEETDFLTQVAGQVAIVIDNSLAHRRIARLTEKLTPESVYFDDETPTETEFEDIIGRSTALRALLRQVETVAPTDSTVLIQGETGTGKELIARALHNRSSRRSGPFVKLNCAAIPTGLLESELFGHERGAFTSAIAQRIGRFELAHRGTIFLDEIGEIPLELQPKLLRVLQEREFERLGSSKTQTTDARLIAATNRDLYALAQEQKFRSDLYYRLNVFPLQVPALRERRGDIPLLVQHFVQHFSRRMKRNIESVSKDGMEALVDYNWPGNVRELENVIERAVIMSPGPELRVPTAELSRTAADPNVGKPQTLEEAERAHILATLKKTHWILAGPNGAAKQLGLNRSTLQFRMKKLGIQRPGL